jgi:hypothetical protein
VIKETSLALNTKNWLPKEGESIEKARNRTTHDFAAALIEQKEAPPEERIHTYTYILGENGQLSDRETGEKPTLRWTTKLTN